MMACVLFTRERTRQCATTLCFWRDLPESGYRTGLPVETGSRRKKNVTLQLDSSIKNPEGYRVNVSASGVVIAGASEAGVFYGIQTLRKAIPVKANSVPVLPLSG